MCNEKAFSLRLLTASRHSLARVSMNNHKSILIFLNFKISKSVNFNYFVSYLLMTVGGLWRWFVFPLINLLMLRTYKWGFAFESVIFYLFSGCLMLVQGCVVRTLCFSSSRFICFKDYFLRLLPSNPYSSFRPTISLRT